MRSKTIDAVLLSVALVLIVAETQVAVAENSRESGGNAAKRRGLVKTAPPQRRDFSESYRCFGQVKGKRDVKIVALAAGRILAVDAEDGAAVSDGDPLFTLGGVQIDSRRVALEARLGGLEERVGLARRRADLKRDAVSRKLAKYEELATAEDALARLETEMESAKQEKERLEAATHIRAPSKGVFSGRKVNVGQDVQAGEVLAQLISAARLYVEATLFPEGGELELMGKPSAIKLRKGEAVPGKVVKVFPQRTRENACLVWIEGPTFDQALHSGQSVSGDVVYSSQKDALAVPRSALVRDENERAFLFVKEGDAYVKRPVETGLVSEGWIEIMTGLKEGDEVVVQGAYELLNRDFNKTYKVAD